MGMPLAMPPLMPPFLLVAVTTLPSRMVNGSFAWEPRRSANAKPAPNSMPLTAGMANARWAISLSTLSKNGSPMPAGTPVMTVSRIPPTLSPSAPAARMAACMGASFSGSNRAKWPGCGSAIIKPAELESGASSTPAQRAMWVYTLIPRCARICSQIEPAATLAAVMRPEKWPPPRASCQPSYLAYAV